jgi:hypothetical protein
LSAVEGEEEQSRILNPPSLLTSKVGKSSTIKLIGSLNPIAFDIHAVSIMSCQPFRLTTSAAPQGHNDMLKLEDQQD